MFLALLLICISLLLVWHYKMQYSKYAVIINRIPSMKMIPLLGHIMHFWPCTTTELWKIIDDICIKYYPICIIWIFTRVNVVILHPDDAEIILNNPVKHTEKAINYSYLHNWLGTGLLTSKGKKWQQRRKILTPAFHFSILSQFVDILNEEANHTKENLLTNKDSVVEDVMSFTSHHALNIICKTAMGTSLENIKETEKQYRKNVYNISDIVLKRTFRPLYYTNLAYSFSSLYKEEMESLKVLHGFSENIIANRKKFHESTGGRYLKNIGNDAAAEANEDGTTDIKKKRLALLDLLIAASTDNKLTDTDIREEIDTFMFEGHDTVSIGLCFTLLLLAEHKEIQDRVRKEVTAVIKKSGEKFTMSTLQNLTYLERCIKESLRLYPSVPIISRVNSEDVVLSKSYLVPANTILHINIFKINRNPNFWPNPEVFDPDRFIADNIQARHPYSYIPFSAGPRNCIGQRFALMELKAMVASIIYNFYLEPVDYLKNIKFKMDLVLRSSTPIRMKCVPIKHAA